MILPIKTIRLDFQGPEYLDEEKVWEIANALRSGEILPPIVARYDGENYWCQDGFHRVAAAVSLGSEDIEAEVIPGTLADIESDHKQFIAALRSDLSKS